MRPCISMRGSVWMELSLSVSPLVRCFVSSQWISLDEIGLINWSILSTFKHLSHHCSHKHLPPALSQHPGVGRLKCLGRQNSIPFRQRFKTDNKFDAIACRSLNIRWFNQLCSPKMKIIKTSTARVQLCVLLYNLFILLIDSLIDWLIWYLPFTSFIFLVLGYTFFFL